jgi:hypothetical protein
MMSHGISWALQAGATAVQRRQQKRHQQHNEHRHMQQQWQQQQQCVSPVLVDPACLAVRAFCVAAAATINASFVTVELAIRA